MEEKGKKKNIWRRHWPEITLGGVVLAAAVACALYFSLRPAPESLSAEVRRANEILLNVDLSKESEERDIEIQGAKTPMTLRVKHNAICVAKSGCPSQYCVSLHYVNSPSTPIVCAYNQVTITLFGNAGGGGDIG